MTPIGDLELERVMASGWLAEHREWLGGWLLRASEGFTGRANSVLPLGDPARPIDDALGHVTTWYAHRGLTARCSVPSPACADLGDALAERGWTAAWGALVMTADADDIPRSDGPPVRLERRPSSAWQAAYHYRGGSLPAAGRRLLERHDTAAFASVEDGGEVVAIGRGVVDEGWIGITAVEVSPSHRRQGLARRILGVLVSWGAEEGATRVYLQVDLDNGPAIAMYGTTGFTVHHTYRYWDAPLTGGRERRHDVRPVAPRG